MKQGSVAFILLLFLGLMVQAAGAEDVEIKGSVKADSFSGDGSQLTGISAGNITTGTISVDRLENFSVTPVKIAFFRKVAVVATSGGDYSNPATAMSDANVSSWCGTPSSDNRCLLKIMPGVYDLGTCDTSGAPPFSCVLYMKEYIDIEGSGENTTKITGAVSGSSIFSVVGVVMGASSAELRFLTIENTGPGLFTAAIRNSASSPSIVHVTATTKASGGTHGYGVRNVDSSPTMTDVTATSSDGAFTNYGVRNETSSPTMTNVTAKGSGGTTSNYGVFNDGSSPTMTNVTATGSGAATNNYGVNNNGSSPTMTNVTATGSGGTNNYGVKNTSPGTVRINHSVIRGATATINNGAGVTTLVGNSQLDGGTISGTITCVGAYDTNYIALGTDCLPLPPP